MARRGWVQGAAPWVCAVALMQGACDEEVRIDCSRYTEWESCIYDAPSCAWSGSCLRRCEQSVDQCDEEQTCVRREVKTGGEAAVAYAMVCVDE